MSAVAPSLHPCLWLRVHCAKCGEYDVALDPKWKAPERCHYCRKHIAVSSPNYGKTTRELPYFAEPIPKRWGSTNLCNRLED